jgi:hypothetical protein
MAMIKKEDTVTSVGYIQAANKKRHYTEILKESI